MEQEAQEVSAPAASKKRAVKSKKRREAQQEFSHPWMVGSLKGHAGQILDVDVSANGKFVATCADGKLLLLASDNILS